MRLPGPTPPFDPVVAELLASMKAQGFPGWAYLTVDQGQATMSAMRSLAGEPEPISHTEDLVLPGTPDLRGAAVLPPSERR